MKKKKDTLINLRKELKQDNRLTNFIFIIFPSLAIPAFMMYLANLIPQYILLYIIVVDIIAFGIYVFFVSPIAAKRSYLRAQKLDYLNSNIDSLNRLSNELNSLGINSSTDFVTFERIIIQLDQDENFLEWSRRTRNNSRIKRLLLETYEIWDDEPDFGSAIQSLKTNLSGE